MTDQRAEGDSMRNLIGRLNARTPAELEKIAQVWRIPLSGRDKLARVATLYRAMTTHWVARELWDRLEPAEREVVTALIAAGDKGASLKSLGQTLGREIADLRTTATALYRAGILARDGDDDHLPIGEEPRLFVPRELIQELTQVRDERARGDVADRPLREHLDTLDDRELEEAAERWGGRVVAGATARETLVRQILAATADPRRRDHVVKGLDKAARELWDHIRTLDSTAPIPLETARRLAGGSADAEVGPAFRFLQTLADLEESLLLLPTMIDDQWGLTIQREAASGTGEASAGAALTPIAVVGLEPPWRHPHTVAWDVLTLIQWLTGPGSDPELDPLDLPEAVEAALTERLWNGRTHALPEGYLAFLLTLAADQGLLDEPDEGAGSFRRTDEIRAWRLRTFPAQSSASGSAGSATPTGSRTSVGRTSRSAPPTGRRSGSSCLPSSARSGLAPGSMWPRSAGGWPGATPRSSAGRPRSRRPGPAGRTASQAVSRPWSRRRLRPASPGSASSSLRLRAGTAAWSDSPRRAWPSPGPEPIPEAEERGKPLLEVAHDGTVTLTDPTPLQVWSVLAFAEPVALDRSATYRLTEASVRAALASGFDLDQITSFLEKQQGSPLPDKLSARLEGWRTGAKRVRLGTAVLLASDDDPTREMAKLLLEQDGYRVSTWENRLLVETGLRRDPEVDAKRIDALLRAAGVTISRVEPKP
jgi:hypothetical protein